MAASTSSTRQTESRSRYDSGGGGKSSKDEGYPPLEKRIVECRSETGVVTKVPALNKRWAQSINNKWVEFYLPEVNFDDNEGGDLLTWVQYMEMLSEDFKWLLQLPHYQFWSVMIYSPAVSQEVLTSFLVRAPRFYDVNYKVYQSHEVIWPIYKDIYALVFRVFMRLATYKESKEDHITPSYWASLIHDNEILGIPQIMNLCTLYEGKDNPLFKKMIENIVKNEPRMLEHLFNTTPILIQKFEELSRGLEALVQENIITQEWDVKRFEDILWFKLDAIYSIYKLLKVYPEVAGIFQQYPSFVSSMANSYEINTRRWGKVVANMRGMEERVSLFRAAMLRLFRAVLATPTILMVESANDTRLDEFFDCFASCLDEKVFIHDYEKAFPFKNDMHSLLSRGIFIDETRIDYMANAISACFHACGEEYSVEKIVVDPLYDPHFDRQLLGACSLEVTGVELESLISQVKDLLPDLPDSYIEAVLKHYGYTAESTINALLEGSVPSRLEKYKNAEYVKSQSSQSLQQEVPDPVQDQLPVHFESDGISLENGVGPYSFNEKFYTGKRSHGYTEESKFLDSDKDSIKTQVLENLQKLEKDTMTSVARGLQKCVSKNSKEEDDNHRNTYIDESLLPRFNESVEYDDEYDDTYDDLGAGMIEPDNLLFNPLNRRKVDYQEEKNGYGEQEDENETYKPKGFNDAFCEDPAVVRARYERKRAEQQSRRGGSHHQPQQPQQHVPRDVVGNAKGQGQEKDVLYNRRQKTTNKGAGGSWKKKSDFKRKEF